MHVLRLCCWFHDRDTSESHLSAVSCARRCVVRGERKRPRSLSLSLSRVLRVLRGARSIGRGNAPPQSQSPARDLNLSLALSAAVNVTMTLTRLTPLAPARSHFQVCLVVSL